MILQLGFTHGLVMKHLLKVNISVNLAAIFNTGNLCMLGCFKLVIVFL